jgi:hypothetical protein
MITSFEVVKYGKGFMEEEVITTVQITSPMQAGIDYVFRTLNELIEDKAFGEGQFYIRPVETVFAA